MKKNYVYDLIPKDTFLEKVVRYYDTIGVPQVYSLAIGIFLLSNLLTNKSYVMHKYKRYYMNFMFFLLGDDSVISKCDAIHDMENLFSKFYQKSKIISTFTEPKALNSLMENSNDNNIAMIATELLSSFGKNYDYFQDLYNNPVERRGYYGKHEYIIRDIYFNCLVSSTFESYVENITRADINCDWTKGTNLLIPYAGRSIKTDDESDIYPIETIGKEASKICKEGPFTFTTNSYFAQSLRRYIDKGRCTEPRFTAFFARRGELAIKLSGIFAANRHCKEITVDDLQIAKKYIEILYRDMKEYVKSATIGVESDEISDLIRHIQRILLHQSVNGIKHSELYNRVRVKCDKDLFRHIMNIMHELGLIDKYMMDKSKAILYMMNVNTQTLDCSKIVKKLKQITTS